MVDSPFVCMCGGCNNPVWDEKHPHGDGVKAWYCSEKCWNRRNDLAEVMPSEDGPYDYDTVRVNVSMGVSDEMLDLADGRARKALPKYMAIARQVVGELLGQGAFDVYHLWEDDSYENRKRLADNVSSLIIGPQGPGIEGVGRTWIVPEDDEDE